MKTTIVGRKCTPKDSFKAHADKKLQKIDKFFSDEAEAKITVTVEKSEQIVELTIKSRGMYFRAEESAVDMNDALDACIDFIIRKNSVCLVFVNLSQFSTVINVAHHKQV